MLRNQSPLFDASEEAACRKLVALALEEDLGDAGDITSQAIIPADLAGKAAFIARQTGVIAGLPAASLVCAAIDKKLTFEPRIQDGANVKHGDCLATVSGPMRSLVAAERPALNFLQRLSGIATLTARYVEAIAGLPARILDTRKTTPGWRLLEKYAVRCGGAHNHRKGLYDEILIKDNHLAAIASECDIDAAVARAIDYTRGTIAVQVEVESHEQLLKLLSLGKAPTSILLDNMTTDQLKACVETCRKRWGPTVEVEASGGVNLQTVRAIAETGVDRISVGALTHSAPALDIALDYLHEIHA